VSGGTVLAIRAPGLGDLLTVVPALRALADAFPDHRRLLATPAWLHPLATHIGVADELIPGDGPGGPPLDQRAEGAEVAVNLHGRGPQSHELLLATRPRRLVAFAHPAVPCSAGSPRWWPGEHEVARWCRLLTESGIPADPRRLDVRPPGGAPPPGSAGATLLHPGAASPARRWPAARFAAVARSELRQGRQVVISGGPGEAELAGRVAELAGLPPSANLAGNGDLLALAGTVAAAGRVVCGDTGVAHLATALGTPSVVLFGPVPPTEWGPPPDRPWHRALWAGSRGDPHGLQPDPGLLEISVGEVLEALASLPDRVASGRARSIRCPAGDARAVLT
jgi:ADP-heptose:LPS heptosyltransferase